MSQVSEIPAEFGPSVVTLGNFDGVHRGHRAVLADVVARAAAQGLTPVAVTFDPHPVAVLHPERAPQVLTSLEHRLCLIEAVGLQAVLVMEFTRDLAQWTPEEFVRRVFVDGLHARVVVVGRDTRFGVRNSGDVNTLRQLGEQYGFEVVVVDEQGVEDPERGRWSSSLVRRQLEDGDVAGAASVLGRPHRVSGTVVHGHHRGRDLGFPTANLSSDSRGLIPADGVYAGWLHRPALDPQEPDSTLPAAISVGTNPTFEDVERTVEAYVLDRDDLDLYGETVDVEFVGRLRPMLRFESMDELITQMQRDVEACREVLRSIVPPA